MCSSRSSRRFELLPTELQCHILIQISDFKSLQALISASSQYFRVYRAFKAPILSKITRNAIDPALLPIAMDAHQQRERYKGEQKSEQGSEQDSEQGSEQG